MKAQPKRHFNFDGSRWMWLSFLLEVLVYIYGGYLGLGMGILMYTIYALFSHMSLHHAQGNQVKGTSQACSQQH